jgi:hypothetical protein
MRMPEPSPPAPIPTPDEGPTGGPADVQAPAAFVDQDVGAELLEKIARREYRYAMIGLILGALVLGAGVMMIFVRVSGAVDLTIHVGGSEIHLNTAVVGIAMAVIGALIILFTRPNLVIGKKRPPGR